MDSPRSPLERLVRVLRDTRFEVADGAMITLMPLRNLERRPPKKQLVERYLPSACRS
jgi:hypothetical protein